MVNTSSENCIESKKEMGSSALEYDIKVRKPYTITKQRERWTEEEHNKFLEALNLYGRAWRQIEEHIGTKSAIQIRSHAQKFFTKVGRESDKVKTFDIPPPRPKKKPTKPYPRKLGNLPKIQVIEKPEWSLIPKLTISNQELEILSPTSILSAIESDAFGSSSSVSASDQINNSTGHVETLLNERENDSQSAMTSVENEEQSLSMLASDMELDLGLSIEQPIISMKLFGQVVVMSDSQKPFCSHIVAEHDHESFPANDAKSYSLPNFFGFPSCENIVNMPWLCGLSNNNVQSSVREESLDDNFEQKDDSSIELSINGGARNRNEHDAMPKFKLNHSERSAFKILKVTSKNPTRGFVPYKK